MGAGGASGAGMAWLSFALMTVACWGVYGVLLHSGQVSMQDPVNGRYKAFLFVGVAYFVTAVLAPLAILKIVNGATWQYPVRGMGLSLLAGTVGAAGAFCVLLAFRRQGLSRRRHVDRFRRSSDRQRDHCVHGPSAGGRAGEREMAVRFSGSHWRPWGAPW